MYLILCRIYNYVVISVCFEVYKFKILNILYFILEDEIVWVCFSKFIENLIVNEIIINNSFLLYR